VCGETLELTRLHCRQCDTSIEGHFMVGRLSRLDEEQIHFVETFLRCEGTIKRVEKELNISYPTVRARLKEVIRALGFIVVSDYADVDTGTMSTDERSAILDQVYRGEITSEEAVALLRGQH
jgi:hypothetical protein